MHKLNSAKRWVMLGAAVVVVVGLAGLGVATLTSAQGGGGNTIHACANNTSGLVRIVSPGESCRPQESPLQWDAEAGVGQYSFVCGGCDLYLIDLSGAHLPNAWLRNAIMAGADLSDTDLSNAVLYGAELAGAILTDADLTGASLKSADLFMATLMYADLTGANLTYANLDMAYLDYADLTDADLTGTPLALTFGLDEVTWSNTTCPDGSNSDDDDGDGFTCLNNVTP